MDSNKNSAESPEAVFGSEQTVVNRLHETYRALEVGAFLPNRAPCASADDFPPGFAPYFEACAQLPDYYHNNEDGVRDWLREEFSDADPGVLAVLAELTPSQHEGLHTVLAALGHAFRWDKMPAEPDMGRETRIILPEAIARPWAALAEHNGSPQVGTAWTLHLCNWVIKNRPGGAAYRVEELLDEEKLGVAVNWLKPPLDMQLETFSLAFVRMEALGATALSHIVGAVEAAATGDITDSAQALQSLSEAIEMITVDFNKHVLRGGIDVKAWLEIIQPSFKWAAEADKPGEIAAGPSGLQTSTIRALDSFLGIEDPAGFEAQKDEAWTAIPVPHRELITALTACGVFVRRHANQPGNEHLKYSYNQVVQALTRYRGTHYRGARSFLSKSTGGHYDSTGGIVVGGHEASQEPVQILGAFAMGTLANTKDASLR